MLLRKQCRPYSLETTRRSAVVGGEPAAESLLSWLQQNGGTVVNGVTYQRSQHFGYGLCVENAVAAGDELVLVPDACTLRVDDGRDIPEKLQRLVAGAGGDSSAPIIPEELWGLRLGLRLLHERSLGTKSPWASYVALLPETYGVPMFFAPEEVAALQYPPLAAQVAKRGRFLQTICSEFDLSGGGGRAIFNGLTADMGAVGWAFAAVTSRAFRLRGPNMPASLLPVIDLCNHAFKEYGQGSSVNCEVLPHQGSDGSGGAKLVATRDICPGEELLINYGDLSNDLFLLDYGFLPGLDDGSAHSSDSVHSDNPFDTVEVSFSPQILDAAAAISNVDLNLPDGKLLRYQEAVLATLGLQPNAPGSVFLGAGAAAAAGWDGSGGANANLGVDPRLVAAARVLSSRSIDDLTLPASSSLRSAKKEKTPKKAQKGGSVTEFPPQCALGTLGGGGKTDGALGRSGETVALRSMLGLCATTLSSFPTTIEEDRALLAQGRRQGSHGAMSLNMRTAVAFRATKKKHLVDCIASLAELARQLTPPTSPSPATPPKKKQGSSGEGKGFGYNAKYFGDKK